jgi:hypothetical protein
MKGFMALDFSAATTHNSKLQMTDLPTHVLALTFQNLLS